MDIFHFPFLVYLLMFFLYYFHIAVNHLLLKIFKILFFKEVSFNLLNGLFTEKSLKRRQDTAGRMF